MGGTFFFDPRDSDPSLLGFAALGVLISMVGEQLRRRVPGFQARADELSDQRRLLQSITDNATTALIIMDDRQHCIFMNPAAEQLTGYTLAQTRGRPMHDVVHHTRPDGTPYPLADCPIDRAFPTDDQMRGEEVFVHKDGHFYHVEFCASPNRDERGNPIGTVIELRDISERKRREQFEQEQSTLLEMCATNAPVSHCLNALTESVSRLQPDARAAVLVANGERSAIEAGFSVHFPPPFADALKGAPIDDLPIGTCGTAIHEGRPVTCADIAAAPNWSTAWKGLCLAHGINACYSHPIFARDGQAIASLFLCLADAREPTAWEREIATFGARLAGIVLERDRAALAVRRGEDLFRATFENAAVGIAHVTPDGRWLRVNESLCRLTGYRNEELLARTFADITHPDDLDADWSNVTRLLDGEADSYQIEKRYIRKDGSIFPAVLTVSLLRHADGTPNYFVSVVDDISERKNAEEALRRSEERYRTLFNTIQDGFCIVRMIYDDAGRPVDFVITEGNPALAEQTGLKNAVGRLIREAEPGIEPFWIETYGRIARTGVAERFENHVAAWDRWFDVYAYRFGDPANQEVAVFFRDVSARKRGEVDLQQSRRLLATALDAAEMGTWVYTFADQVCQYDPRAQELYGLDSPRWVHDERNVQERFHPDDVGQMWAAVQHACKPDGDGRYAAQYRVRQQDGGWRWLSVWGLAEFEGSNEQRRATRLIGASRDVTASTTAVEMLSESESFYRQTLESVPGMAFTNRPDGSCDFVSEQWVQFTGVPASEQLGAGWVQVLHPDDRARAFAAWRAAVEERGHYDLEYRLRRADGAYEWFKVRGRPLRDSKGTIVRWFGMAVNVNDLKLAEDSLRESGRLKDEFLAILAHELRNPLAAIRMAATMLKTASHTAETVDRMGGIIDRQSSQLARLIDDLLDVSRVTRGQIELHKQRVDVVSLVRRAIETTQPLVDANGITIHADFDGPPLFVNADEMRLTQAIGNVLNNACKYSAQGGTIDLAVRQENGAALIRVRDEGAGIDPEKLALIFEMFVQADPRRDRGAGGLGIGLSMVKSLVQMHGGTVEARSAGLGKGSEFLIRLPLMPAAERLDGNPREPAASPVEPRRILAVDDNLDALDALVGVLRAAGHEVLRADNGASALQIAAEARPDAVLLDIGMPDMDGYEVAERIRREPWGSQVQLIAITGWGQDRDKQRAAAAGFDAHITKPATLEAINGLLMARSHGTPAPLRAAPQTTKVSRVP
jgi:PAS domain S-box-containing protein